MGGKYQTALNALDAVEYCLKVVRNADAKQTDEDDFENVAIQCQAYYNDKTIPYEVRERIARIVGSFISGIRNARKSAEAEAVAQAASFFRVVAPRVGRFLLRAFVFLLFLAFAVAFYLDSRPAWTLVSLTLSATVVKLNAPFNALAKLARARIFRK